MANFTFISLQSEVSGNNQQVDYEFDSNQKSISFVIPETNGTVSIGNLSLRDEDRSSPGYLTGRRPIKGQVFPRGVYNK
jgi:hypothetical protein